VALNCWHQLTYRKILILVLIGIVSEMEVLRVLRIWRFRRTIRYVQAACQRSAWLSRVQLRPQQLLSGALSAAMVLPGWCAVHLTSACSNTAPCRHAVCCLSARLWISCAHVTHWQLCICVQWQHQPTLAVWMRSGAIATALLTIVKPLAWAAVGLWRSNFELDRMSRAIDASMKPIGIGLLLLAALS